MSSYATGHYWVPHKGSVPQLCSPMNREQMMSKGKRCPHGSGRHTPAHSPMSTRPVLSGKSREVIRSAALSRGFVRVGQSKLRSRRTTRRRIHLHMAPTWPLQVVVNVASDCGRMFSCFVTSISLGRNVTALPDILYDFVLTSVTVPHLRVALLDGFTRRSPLRGHSLEQSSKIVNRDASYNSGQCQTVAPFRPKLSRYLKSCSNRLFCHTSTN
ncbi:hypothetical protein J3A83DRAFT_3237149 [Scleroderma citrinum]